MPLIVVLFLLLQFVGHWYLTDRLGSVTGITDATGALINSTTYDSYGHILSQSNPAVADPLAFTGREFDAETGLYYFRARYFNPDLGRFQSEDPIQFKAGDDNLSRYVFNSPLNFLDPRGRDAELETKEIQVTINQRAGAGFEETVEEAWNFDANKSLKLADGRIPDILDEDYSIIGEIKNVKYLSLTAQLRSYIEFARSANVPFVLIINQGATLSGPLIDELIDLGATIIVE